MLVILLLVLLVMPATVYITKNEHRFCFHFVWRCWSTNLPSNSLFNFCFKFIFQLAQTKQHQQSGFTYAHKPMCRNVVLNLLKIFICLRFGNWNIRFEAWNLSTAAEEYYCVIHTVCVVHGIFWIEPQGVSGAAENLQQIHLNHEIWELKPQIWSLKPQHCCRNILQCDAHRLCCTGSILNWASSMQFNQAKK